MDTIHGVKLPDGTVFEIEDRAARKKLEGGVVDGGGVVDYVTPQMYGAVGDGETDDYEAFVAMLATNPKFVYIPQGRYYISETLTISDGLRVLKGAGVGPTAIICENGFISTADTIVYRLTMSDMAITKPNAEDTNGTAISGKFCYSKFSNIYVEHFEHAFEFTGHSWINTLERCELNSNYYGVFNNSEHFNNFIFRDCAFQSNEYAVYIGDDSSAGGKNIVFDGCDVEQNGVAFHTKAVGAFVVRDSYIENNTKVFEILTPCYGADWTFENCFIYSVEEKNGWFIDLPTTNINTNPASDFNIERCYIRHNSADYTPFAFHDSYSYSTVAVNIHGCRFYHRPDTYFDLFDLTNCVNYGNAYNRLPIDTDLVYFKMGTCKWFIHSGNSYDSMRKDTYFEMFGYLPVLENSESGIAVEISPKVGKIENSITGAFAMVQGEDAESGETVNYSVRLYNVSQTSLGFKVSYYPDGYNVDSDSLVFVTGVKY